MTNPSMVAFEIFGREIRWYGIIIALAMLCGIGLALRSANAYKWKQDDILDFAFLAIPLGAIGARIYYVMFEWPLYVSNPISAFKIWEGGLALFGGLIGGCIAAVIFAKWKKLNLIELLDICIPSFAIGQAIGRWGNFFNQEAFGAEITNKALQWFPFAVHIDLTNTVHYATFFYESAWCALLCVFLLTQRKKFKHVGDSMLWYLMLYGFERMIIEGLRTDSLYIGSIRVSQALSALLFVGVAIFMTVRYLKERNGSIVISNKANVNFDWNSYYSLHPDRDERVDKEAPENSQREHAQSSHSQTQQTEEDQTKDQDQTEEATTIEQRSEAEKIEDSQQKDGDRV